MELTKELLKNHICKDEKQLNKYINKFPQAYKLVLQEYKNQGNISKAYIQKKHGYTSVNTFIHLFGSWSAGIELCIPEIKDYSIYTKEYTKRVDSENKKYTVQQWVDRLEQHLSDKNRTGSRIPKHCPKEAVDMLISKYGSIDSAELILSGENSETRKRGKEEQKLKRAIEELKSLYSSDKPVTKNQTPLRIQNPITKEFGSYEAGVETILKINYEEYKQDIWRMGVEKGRSITVKWNKESLKNWLITRVEAGLPCTYMAVKNLHVFERIVEIYGTYSALWEACNLDYTGYIQKHREGLKGVVGTLSYELSLVGYSFEVLIDDIISCFGFGYTKHYLKGTNLLPDYNINNGAVLGDAKLTFGYKNTAETIEKYSPHCSRLEFYFLNSNFDYKESKFKNTDVIYYNVDKLIKCLPEEYQDFYTNKVLDLRREVDSIYKKYKTPCTA